MPAYLVAQIFNFLLDVCRPGRHVQIIFVTPRNPNLVMVHWVQNPKKLEATS
jgi:hypothetical protein